MKEFLKTRWQVILIVVLAIFGLSKCTQSCNRDGELQELQSKKAGVDSTVNELRDSIVTLNHQIELLTHDKTSQAELVATQKEAMDKINEAKKNINVTVKK